MKHSLLVSALFSVLASASFAQSSTTSTPTNQTLPGQTAPAHSPFRAISSTHYTPHSELFAEYRPLLLYVPARFTAHLTQVGETAPATRFKPYTDAEVTLKLTIDGKTAWQQTQKQPVAPGTYRFPIKSEVAGTGKVTIDLKMPTYSEQFIVDNVTVYPDEQTALAQQAPAGTPTGDIAYAKEQSWVETFATAPVTKTKGAVYVPQTALLTENGSAYIYVQRDPEHFRKQAVQTGKQNGNTIEITSGLQAGERIITLGADKLK